MLAIPKLQEEGRQKCNYNKITKLFFKKEKI
jgi:hypothetical protein